MIQVQNSSRKKFLSRLFVLDIVAIVITLSYIVYINYIAVPTYYICPAYLSQGQINRTSLLQKVDFAEHGLYSLPGCVSLSIQYSQAVYNKYNISVNVTHLENLVSYRAFWNRSLLYIGLLLIEVLIAILILYMHILNS